MSSTNENTSSNKIPSEKRESFTGTRLTTHSSQSFPTIMTRLYSELGSPATIKYPLVAQSIKSYDSASRDAFSEAVEKAIGPRGFMLFQEFDHASWLPLFLSPPALEASFPGLKRLILGNPLIAKTMLQHDFTAGLFVPVELLVRELTAGDGGGTDLIYVLPSSLIAGIYDRGGPMEMVLKAAEKLDEKLKNLVDSVAGD